MEEITNYIGYALIALGLFFTLTSSLGIFRFRDFFTRIHAAGIVDSLGAPLVLLGLIFVEGFTIASLKIAVLIFLIYLTAPTACHALAKAGYHLRSDRPENDNDDTSPGSPPRKG